jgi:hypothetical protein
MKPTVILKSRRELETMLIEQMEESVKRSTSRPLQNPSGDEYPMFLSQLPPLAPIDVNGRFSITSISSQLCEESVCSYDSSPGVEKIRSILRIPGIGGEATGTRQENSGVSSEAQVQVFAAEVSESSPMMATIHASGSAKPRMFEGKKSRSGRERVTERDTDSDKFGTNPTELSNPITETVTGSSTEPRSVIMMKQCDKAAKPNKESTKLLKSSVAEVRNPTPKGEVNLMSSSIQPRSASVRASSGRDAKLTGQGEKTDIVQSKRESIQDIKERIERRRRARMEAKGTKKG